MNRDNMTDDEILGADLSVSRLRQHQRRISSYVAGSSRDTIPILDTCRLENGGILSEEFLSRYTPPTGYISFVPSAGAASRYFQKLEKLIDAIDRKHHSDIASELNEISLDQIKEWSLPGETYQIFKRGVQACIDNGATIQSAFRRPKAFQPAKADGSNYLERKLIENSLLSAVEQQVYISAIGKSAEFQSFCSKKSETAPLILEQDATLSTIRFHRSGSVYREADGSLSLVPAGHGTLIDLFKEVKKQFPHQHSMFIRNIDNVIEMNEDSTKAINRFLGQHQTVLSAVKEIRTQLQVNRFSEANHVAKSLLSNFTSATNHIDQDNSFPEPDMNYLWQMQKLLFNGNLDTFSQFTKCTDPKEIIKLLFSRPVNSLGQVPNSGKDVGGAPVIVKTQFGPTTICLELPHASEDDKREFFQDPRKATHFNPVFVAAELVDDISFYEDDSLPFWILAKKIYKNESVIYHESVLYELLGNNLMANVMFPMIPRTLFNPHKTFMDAQD